ncbi:hypothetical protein RHGRI_026452 [Rhododendron griersonianum]|uniref:DNA topoisomerase 2 n=1 Tax=Rhododendron griersonianum TaxID=479676 RepID=A0AAV6ITW0_9ERIC|nr:hypothetical protein RHGRI_026452 [Rhododendron griersonianum]
MVHRPITYVPGLYKIFDEILVNAADNKQRDPSMDAVRVDVEQNLVSVYNSGDGPGRGTTMALQLNSDLGITASTLPTGLIFPSAMKVFSNNMGKKSEPIITKCKGGENWTKVSFKPDLAKFNMTHLEDDVVALMKMRVSFVNSIATIKGGTHVDYITNQITNHVMSIVNKNKNANLKAHMVKNHLWIFVNALIDNPAFDSQTKETLTIRQSSFGLKCELSQEFLKKDFKQSKDLKKTNGTKRQRIIGITKLEDANDAGGEYSDRCTLILTEGDSAKALAHRKEYDSVKSLRYGHLMIMTDQDHDGSHIKGLLINFIHSFWPSLLKIPSFLVEFITPIMKANHRNGKGLGTSTSKEGKEYFNVLESHRKNFIWEDEHDGEVIELAFSKKKIEARKNWLRHFEPGTYLDQKEKLIKYSDFVNKELILFSMADLQRSIPSMVDGLKPEQRKILFCSFKHNFAKEAKVVQFSGYVSEHSAYHHGEQSLASTIIGKAQDYVASHSSSAVTIQCSAIYKFKIYVLDGALSSAFDFFSLPTEEKSKLMSNDVHNPVRYATSLKDGVDKIQFSRAFLKHYAYPLEDWVKSWPENPPAYRISELPIRRWTQDYKEFLESIMTGNDKIKDPFIKDYREHNDDTIVHFEVILSGENMTVAKQEGLLKKFKLTTTISTSNMHLFDAKGMIKKYDNPEQILLDNLEMELLKLDNKVRFLLGVVKGDIIVSNRKRAELFIELRDKRFTLFPKKTKNVDAAIAVAIDNAEEAEENSKVVARSKGVRASDYEYLLSMAIGTLTLEKFQELCADRDKLNGEVDELSKATPKSLWIKDLDALERELDEQDKTDVQAKAARNEMKSRVMGEAGLKVVTRQAPKNPRKNNNKKTDDTETVSEAMETTSSSAMEIDDVPEVAKPKGRAGPKKAPARKQEKPSLILRDEDDDEVLELKDRLAAYNLESSPDHSEGMETEVHEAQARKKAPSTKEEFVNCDRNF